MVVIPHPSGIPNSFPILMLCQRLILEFRFSGYVITSSDQTQVLRGATA